VEATWRIINMRASVSYECEYIEHIEDRFLVDGSLQVLMNASKVSEVIGRKED